MTKRSLRLDKEMLTSVGSFRADGGTTTIYTVMSLIKLSEYLYSLMDEPLDGPGGGGGGQDTPQSCNGPGTCGTC